MKVIENNLKHFVEIGEKHNMDTMQTVLTVKVNGQTFTKEYKGFKTFAIVAFDAKKGEYKLVGVQKNYAPSEKTYLKNKEKYEEIGWFMF